jgi:tRNA threonylcarbamoyladenosine biosynthesis protein TsaE
LGVEGYVRSPTFVLMTRHRGRLTLHHIDLYRIGGPAEAWDLGLDEELSGDGVCVVEWADRAGDVLDTGALWLDLAYAARENERIIEITQEPERYRPLLDALACHPSASGRRPAGET